jgi:hypothetical protein
MFERRNLMGLLMMTTTIGGLCLAFILLIIAVLTKQVWLSKFALGSVAVWLVFYTTMLLGVSLASREKVLGLNQPKEFCGFYLDCHMHAAVTDVRRTKTLGDRTASGEFYIVRVKVFSDARQATLGLLTVEAKVVGEQNREFRRDTEAEANLGGQPPFDRRISPPESFEKEIVFDLPTDVINPRLDIKEGYGIDHAIEAVLIGDEDSLLHKRVRFKLDADNRVAQN